MSIQRMRRRFARQLRIALWVLTAAFVIGLPLAVGPGLLRGERRENSDQATAREVMARVNGDPVRRSEVDRAFEQTVAQMLPIYEQLGQSVGLERLWRFRLDGLEQAVMNRLLAERAREQGLRVSDREVRQRAEQQVDLQLNQWRSQYEGENLERLFASIIAQAQGERPRETVSEQRFRKWFLDRTMEHSEELKLGLLIEKLRTTVVASVEATEQELKQSYDQVTARQILVSIHPAGGEERTKDEARERAQELHNRLKEGADFAALAREESDDPAAEDTGGLLENIGRGQMPQEWEDAVFSLEVGQIAKPIELDWGYVIVKLEDIRRQLPEDFAEKKDQHMDRFLQQKREEAWRDYREELRGKAEVEVVSSEMQAYQALEQGEREEALSLLRKAAAEAREVGGLTATSVFYQIATLLAAQNEWEEASNAYVEAHDALSSEETIAFGSGRAQALMGMGRASEQMGELEDAATWYRAAGEATEAPAIHEQLRMAYERLNKDDLAEQEREWLEEYRKEQQERMEAMEAQRQEAEQGAAEGETPAGGN